MGIDKRLSFRKRILKRAKFSFNDQFCSSECVIRNISETGAFIDVGDGLLLPKHFKLHNEMDGYDVDCEIVRRIGNSAGVKFIGPREPRSPIRRQSISIDRRRQRTDICLSNEESETMSDVANSADEFTTSAPYRKNRVSFGKR